MGARCARVHAKLTISQVCAREQAGRQRDMQAGAWETGSNNRSIAGAKQEALSCACIPCWHAGRKRRTKRHCATERGAGQEKCWQGAEEHRAKEDGRRWGSCAAAEEVGPQQIGHDEETGGRGVLAGSTLRCVRDCTEETVPGVRGTYRSITGGRSLAKRCIMFERRICSNESRVPAQLAKEKADGSSRRGLPSARLSLFFWPGCMARAALALLSASFSDCRAGRRPNTATFMLILASAPARAVRRCRAGDAADGARRQQQLAFCCSRRPAGRSRDNSKRWHGRHRNRARPS